MKYKENNGAVHCGSVHSHEAVEYKMEMKHISKTIEYNNVQME
jgi:hypothetical protein